MTPPLVLGSASPRRARILDAMGLRFEIVVCDVSEIHDDFDPVATVIENARRKHEAIRLLRPGAGLITADTLVFFDGRAIGKPRDLNDAARLLRDFSGRIQIIFTAVALSLPDRPVSLRVESSTVRFKTLSESAIQSYLDRVRPLDRAGAYDIDEQGEVLIAACHGSRTNVMGLPAGTVSDWLRANGYAPQVQE